jgi:hypothetical protein
MPNRFAGLIRVRAWLPVSELPPWDEVCEQLARRDCHMARQPLTKKELLRLSEEDVKQALRERWHPSTQLVDHKGRYLIPIELRTHRVNLKKEFEEGFKNSFEIVNDEEFTKWLEAQGFLNPNALLLARCRRLFSPHRHHGITDLLDFEDWWAEAIIKTLFYAARSHAMERSSLNLPNPKDTQFRQPRQILHPPRLLDSLIKPYFEIKLHKTSLLLLGEALLYERVSKELEENIAEYLVPYTFLKEAMNTRPRGITAKPKLKR